MGVEEGFKGELSAVQQTFSPPSLDRTLRSEKNHSTQNGSIPQSSDNAGDVLQTQFLTFQTDIAREPVFPEEAIKDVPPFPDISQYDEPFVWSLRRKKWMTYLACSVNAVAAYAAGSYASPADVLSQKWGISYVAYNAGITVFTFGFGVAPMVLAPFSEINGRRPVFITTGILFVICQLGCSLTDSFAGMLVARLFLGIGGSTFSTMVGGILADIWVTKDRNTPMVLFTGATLFGTGLGPLISGFVTDRLGWRWVFYLQIISSGVLVALVTIFFKETRGSVILSRKARIINKWYEAIESAGAIGVVLPLTEDEKENDDASVSMTPRISRLRYRVKADEEKATLLKMISVSCYRPFHLLFTEPVVFWFALWISFSWSVLYLQFGSVPLVFRTNYGFTLEQTGAVFTSMCIGAIVSTIMSIYQDTWAVKRFPARFVAPEGRLYFCCIQGMLMPIGLFWFGWTCYPSIHWVVPTIAVGVATMGIFSIFLAVFNYSADVYRIYASSALAATGICRNLLGGSFPLVTRQMFTGLGFQAASSLLGGIGIVLGLVPWVLVFYGPSIRRRSRIAKAFWDEEEKKKLEAEEKERRRKERQSIA